MQSGGHFMKYCPKCKTEFENLIEKCPYCNISLIRENPFNTNTPLIEKSKINNTNSKPKIEHSSSHNLNIAIVFAGIIALGIILCLIISGITSQNESPTYLSDVRCSWCSKVIRADGINIYGHITSFSNEFLECEYCGHNTRITK